jgi:cysteine desulfurase/selenocysteine lyase
LKIQVLSPLANIHRSAIVVFKSRSPEHLVTYLGKRRIIVSARGGGIRVSPHFYNNEGDIDRLISALKTYHS